MDELDDQAQLSPTAELSDAAETPLPIETGATFDNSYGRLPERFYSRLDPTPMPEPRLIQLNRDLARFLRLDPDLLSTHEGIAALAGGGRLSGTDPLAMAYAGHQFGVFVPQLGDGRALLLGEAVDLDGNRRDLHVKGAGRTPFSRGGDGRAPLGPVLREYLVSEAMAALGVPTTRALAALLTGETVQRERALPGAAIVRVAASHVRVGTFEYFAARKDTEALELLTDYCLERHYCDRLGSERPALALLEAVIARQSDLVVRWMLIGFIHGVMNTDNMAISGETIDFGPCAFMDGYDPNQVFSSIDHGGRYAYGNQPAAAHWNLSRLAGALVPIIDPDPDLALSLAQDAIDAYPDRFNTGLMEGLRAKIGLTTQQDGDDALLRDLQDRMAANNADFTLTFRELARVAKADSDAAGDETVRSLFDRPEAFDDWAPRWRLRLGAEPIAEGDRMTLMRSVNPAYIPRNHLVEAVIEAAVEKGDFGPFETLLGILGAPYEDQPGSEAFSRPPEPEEIVHRTFCGT